MNDTVTNNDVTLVTHEPWRLSDTCPADVQFLRWLKERSALDMGVVVHMGTGAHHLVGQTVAAGNGGICVLGLTCSPDELAAYARLVTAEPHLTARYAVIFTDVQMINPRLLPESHVLTLFHLGEPVPGDERRDLYGAASPLVTARWLIRNMAVGGYVLFYARSSAGEKRDAVIAALERTGEIYAPNLPAVHIYEDLLIYRRGYPGRPRE